MPWRNLPDLNKMAMQALTSQDVLVPLQPSLAGNRSIRRRSPNDQASSVGKPRTVTPTSLTRHTPQKTDFRFPPRLSLGGSYC